MGSARRNKFNRNFFIATAIIIAVIIYGSLYPFIFHVPVRGPGPVEKLLHSWAETPQRGDFLANILFYMPLGIFGFFFLAGVARSFPAVLLTIICGALLSTSMELTQYYIAARVTAATDVYANVIGTAVGAIVGLAAGASMRWTLFSELSSNRAPCLLLALWLGYRLYPYVPAIDMHQYWNALKPVILYPRLTGYDLFRYTAIWLTIAALIEGIGGPKRTLLLFPLFIGAVLIAKVMIIGQTLSVPEIAGAVTALAAWLVLTATTGERFRAGLIALLFCGYILAERLSPFHFTIYSRQFGWIPFLSLMYGSLEVNIMSFFEKAFLYGSFIWLLARAGLPMAASVIVVAVILLATSWAEIYLPGRSAEITDAVMAVLIGVIISAIGGRTKASRASVKGTA